MKIGRPTFVNCDPLYWALEEKLLSLEAMGLKQVHFVYGTPTELNKKMKSGEIAVGPISSIEYARHPELYHLLTFPCLSANGSIKSITLFSNKPIDALEGETIAVTRSSATSVALLKILMEYYLVQKATFVEMEPQLSNMLETHAAALLIGDEALRAPRGVAKFSFDLGTLWHEYTRAPMVYAVWAAQKKFAKEHPEKVAAWEKIFRAAQEMTETDQDLFIKQVSQKSSLSEELLKRYFDSLDFQFDPAKRNSLLLFYDYASSLGLCPDCTTLSLWENGAATHYIGDHPPTKTSVKARLFSPTPAP